MPTLKWPATSDQMKAAGYLYDNEATCRRCDATIEWWITPLGKKMPISIIRTATILHASPDLRQPHFADCER
jgi:hypothetical protein